MFTHHAEGALTTKGIIAASMEIEPAVVQCYPLPKDPVEYIAYLVGDLSQGYDGCVRSAVRQTYMNLEQSSPDMAAYIQNGILRCSRNYEFPWFKISETALFNAYQLYRETADYNIWGVAQILGFDINTNYNLIFNPRSFVLTSMAPDDIRYPFALACLKTRRSDGVLPYTSQPILNKSMGLWAENGQVEEVGQIQAGGLRRHEEFIEKVSCLQTVNST
jgi:hypothetical protein